MLQHMTIIVDAYMTLHAQAKQAVCSTHITVSELLVWRLPKFIQ